MTLEEAQEMHTLYVAAEQKVLAGQSYTIGEQTFTRADLAKIQAGRREWADIVRQLGGTTNVARKIRVYGGTPV